MDSDSSDDDALLNQAIFKRSNRRESNKQDKMERALDDAFRDSQRSHLSAVKMQKLLRQNPNDDDDKLLHERVEQIQEAKRRHSIGQSDETDPKSVSQAAAMEADLVCRLGIRRGIVRFDDSHASSFFFRTMDDAMRELRLFAVAGQHPMYDALWKAVDYGILSDFLQSPKLVHPNESLDLDQERLALFCNWLVKLAYSAGLDQDMELVGHSATRTLLALRAKGLFTRLISVREYDDILSCWVHRDNQMVRDLGIETAVCRNLSGLRNFLTLWETAKSLMPETALADASNCMARLVRLSLDDFCGTFALDVQQHSLCDIVRLVTETASNEDQLQSWISQAAEEALNGLNELGPGSEGAEDASDELGCLCLSAAVRCVPIGTSKGDSSKGVLMYQARLALCALYRLVGKNIESPTMEAFVTTVLQENSHSELGSYSVTSLGWMVVSAALACLLHMDAKDNSATNPSNFLATLECLVVCFQDGLLLLAHETTNVSDEDLIEYGSIETAQKVASFLESFDDLVDKIATRTSRRIASSSLFRRAHTVLLLLQLHSSSIRDRLQYLAATNTTKGMVKQAKLSDFFAKAETPDTDTDEVVRI